MLISVLTCCFAFYRTYAGGRKSLWISKQWTGKKSFEKVVAANYLTLYSVHAKKHTVLRFCDLRMCHWHEMIWKVRFFVFANRETKNESRNENYIMQILGDGMWVIAEMCQKCRYIRLCKFLQGIVARSDWWNMFAPRIVNM